MSKKIIAIVAIVLIVAALATILVACVPSSVDKAIAKMKKAGYTVIADKANDGTGGFVAGTLTKGMTAYMYASSKEAKEACTKLNANDIKAKQSGKWVFWGSEDAIKAFKK